MIGPINRNSSRSQAVLSSGDCEWWMSSPRTECASYFICLEAGQRGYRQIYGNAWRAGLHYKEGGISRQLKRIGKGVG